MRLMVGVDYATSVPHQSRAPFDAYKRLALLGDRGRPLANVST